MEQKSVYSSILLDIQSGLLKKLSRSITTTLSRDGNTLICDNISEAEMIDFPFITNTPEANGMLHLDYVQVFLDGSFVPTHVLGLDETLKAKVQRDNSSAFVVGERIFTPFQMFSTNDGIINVNQLIDNLSSVTNISESTLHRIKIYRVVVGNSSYTSASIGGGGGYDTSCSSYVA